MTPSSIRSQKDLPSQSPSPLHSDSELGAEDEGGASASVSASVASGAAVHVSPQHNSPALQPNSPGWPGSAESPLDVECSLTTPLQFAVEYISAKSDSNSETDGIDFGQTPVLNSGSKGSPGSSIAFSGPQNQHNLHNHHPQYHYDQQHSQHKMPPLVQVRTTGGPRATRLPNTTSTRAQESTSPLDHDTIHARGKRRQTETLKQTANKPAGRVPTGAAPSPTTAMLSSNTQHHMAATSSGLLPSDSPLFTSTSHNHTTATSTPPAAMSSVAATGVAGNSIQRLPTPSVRLSVLQPLQIKINEYSTLMHEAGSDVAKLEDELRALQERRHEAEVRYMEAKDKHDDFQRQHRDVETALRGESVDRRAQRAAAASVTLSEQSLHQDPSPTYQQQQQQQQQHEQHQSAQASAPSSTQQPGMMSRDASRTYGSSIANSSLKKARARDRIRKTIFGTG